MDGYPDTPSYNPPPVPITPAIYGAEAAHFAHQQYQILELQQRVQRTADYDEENPVIPDLILHQIVKQQYHKTFGRIFGQHSKKYDIITLLESSEQFLEEAKSNLASYSYQKAASNFIKGYTIFKFADKLNRDPSNADIISALRNLYSDPSFAKLKDIVEDRFIVEKQRQARRMNTADSSSTTLVERQPHHVAEGVKMPSVEPIISPPQLDSAPRTLDPQGLSSSHRYKDIAEPRYIPSNSFPLYDNNAPFRSAPSIPAPPLPSTQEYNRPHQSTPEPTDLVFSFGNNTVQLQRYEMSNGGPPHQYSVHSICGLQNFGNTCYLNSLIQCLYNMTAFSYFFKTNKYAEYVHPVKGKADDICLSYGLGLLFRVMDKHSGSIIAPTRFFGILLKITEFKPNEQQDAQEALIIILNRLHEELSDNEIVPLNFPKVLTQYSEDPEYEKWFDTKVTKEKLSPINSYFEGQQESSLNCQNCGFSSKSYSTFNVLSLNLPPEAARGKSAFSIEGLIDFYTSTEMLKGIDSWDCPKCKKKRDFEVEYSRKSMLQRHEEEKSAISNNNSMGDLFEPSEPPKEKRSKLFFKKKIGKSSSNGSDHSLKLMEQTQLNETKDFESQIRTAANEMTSFRSTKFLSLPSYLVIHIQRSIKDGRLSTNIKYPLILEVPLETGKVYRFKLQSTVNHSGNSPNSGHYTALCNKSDHLSTPRWCHFNDDTFTVDLSHGDLMKGIKRLMSHDVYLLFYERIES